MHKVSRGIAGVSVLSVVAALVGSPASLRAQEDNCARVLLKINDPEPKRVIGCVGKPITFNTGVDFEPKPGDTESDLIRKELDQSTICQKLEIRLEGEGKEGQPEGVFEAVKLLGVPFEFDPAKPKEEIKKPVPSKPPNCEFKVKFVRSPNNKTEVPTGKSANQFPDAVQITEVCTPGGQGSPPDCICPFATLLKSIDVTARWQRGGIKHVVVDVQDARPGNPPANHVSLMFPKEFQPGERPCCDYREKKRFIVNVVELAIDINNTVMETDDLVRLRSTHPDRRFTVLGTVILKEQLSDSVTIVLTNPDGRLGFPPNADGKSPEKTKTATFPPTFENFYISGEMASDAVNDAKIEAYLDTAGGDVCLTKPMTVASLGSASISITKGSNYGIRANRLNVIAPVDGPGVNFSAQASIKPQGVDCGPLVPQLNSLRVGLKQNVVSTTRLLDYASPSIRWFNDVPPGTVVPAPSSWRVAITLASVPIDDSVVPADAPLFRRLSAQPPIGCPNGVPVNDSDSPNQEILPPILMIPALTPTGQHVGTLDYPWASGTIDDSFMTWCVCFDT